LCVLIHCVYTYFVANPNPDKRRRIRPGAVESVAVDPNADRPVTIECHDHAHYYEFAWATNDLGPIITDLRITSREGVPITRDTLKRIPTERLAATAQLADTPGQAETARGLRKVVEAATRDVDPARLVDHFVADLESRGLVTEAESVRRDAAERGAAAVVAEGIAGWDTYRSTLDVMLAAAERTDPAMMSRVRERVHGARRGRMPVAFYEDVAKWARAGRTRRSVYAHIQEQSAAWGHRNPSRDTIRRWIRRAEAEEFLTPGEIRAHKAKEHPVTSTTDQPAKRGERSRKR
jgi:hypothetical protein